MKAKLLEKIYILISSLYRFVNFRKERILVYTDSRGYDVGGRMGRNPFNSYIKGLLECYKTDYFICPEKHTTILDFLVKIESLDLSKYKAIVLHCGVVDFSPRPISNLSFVRKSKSSNKYFRIAEEEYNGHYQVYSDVLYNEERTQTLYSIDFLKDIVIPKLLAIPGLIWINSNHFVPNWNGNHSKGRPANIDEVVSAYDHIVSSMLNTIDLKGWSNEEVMKFTVDNIHFSKVGFKEVQNRIFQKLKC